MFALAGGINNQQRRCHVRMCSEIWWGPSEMGRACRCLSVTHSVCLWESHLQTLPSVTQANKTTHPPQRIHDLLALSYNITASYFKMFVQLCPHQPLRTLALADRPPLFHSSLTGTCTCCVAIICPITCNAITHLLVTVLTHSCQRCLLAIVPPTTSFFCAEFMVFLIYRFLVTAQILWVCEW